MSNTRRLAQALTPTPVTASRAAPATVTAVAPGGAVDGNALVVVEWDGVQTLVPYVMAYTSTRGPEAGDVVALHVQGSQAFVLGRIVGTPD